ncbi:merozoite surface antigen 2 [Elysia marginata]|uniref:Merozoite surface antigen 2 n=1 Tax=Elysia marginata TaxID=1093978 RepID=A0AAV4H540_9GAST|nr:merozoite surface antigen 2 [Elysia marginata]
MTTTLSPCGSMTTTLAPCESMTTALARCVSMTRLARCGSMTTTLAPCDSMTTTLAPSFVIDPSDCFDKDPQCSFLIRSFYCNADPIVSRICPISCGVCTPVTPPPATQGTGPTMTPSVPDTTIDLNLLCLDFDFECPRLVSYCGRTDLLVNRLCRKSCNLCGVDIPAPTTGGSGSVTAGGSGAVTSAPGGSVTSGGSGSVTAGGSGSVTAGGSGSVTAGGSGSVTSGGSGSVTSGGSGSVTSAPAFDPTVGECVDRDPTCPTIVQTNDCTDELFVRVCPVSCGRCTVLSSVPPTALAPPVYIPQLTPALRTSLAPPPATNTPSSAVCQDFDRECFTLQDSCSTVDFVRTLCPLTCQICQVFCRICTDPFCGDQEVVRQCPSDRPFCFNSLNNDLDGSKHVNKTCASELDCVNMWAKDSALDRRCQFYNENLYYYESFSCNYCCIENNCNSQTVPVQSTHFLLP